MSVVSDLNNLSTEELLQLMNEVYDYEKTTKGIDGFPKLKELFDSYDFQSERVMIESYIINEAQHRFSKVVPILLKRYINEYLK